MPAPGKYITLEGGEGTGKTTQVARLVKRLATVGIKAQELREPGGDPFAEMLRTILLGDVPRRPEADVLVFNAARVQTLERANRLMRQGIWAIADRSSLSTITYQAYGEGADIKFTRTICDAVTQVRRPDLQIVINVEEAELKQRRHKRGTLDRFEQMDDEFHSRVNRGYIIEARRARLSIVDGNGTESEVAQRIWTQVSNFVKN